MNALDHIASQLTAGFCNSLWESTVLALGVALILRSAKRTNAATRYALWWGVLLATCALTCWNLLPPTSKRGDTPPKSTAVEPPRRLTPVPVPLPAAEEIALPGPAARPLTPLPPVTPVASASGAAEPAPSGPALSVGGRWALCFVATWIVVGGALLLRLLRCFIHLLRLKRNAEALEQVWQGRLQTIRRDAGISRQVGLFRSFQIRSPVAVGLLRPAILLPPSLEDQLSEEELDHILLHEAAHLGRCDDWSNLLQQGLRALFWPHLVVQWICARLSFERELACDDWVLCARHQPKTFARCLLKLAETVRMAPASELMPGMLGKASQLSKRIEALLQGNRPRSTTVSGLACVLMILILPGALWIATSVPLVVRADPEPAASAEIPVDQPEAAPEAGQRPPEGKSTAKAAADQQEQRLVERLRIDLEAAAALQRRLAEELSNLRKREKELSTQFNESSGLVQPVRQRIDQLEARQKEGLEKARSELTRLRDDLATAQEQQRATEKSLQQIAENQAAGGSVTDVPALAANPAIQSLAKELARSQEELAEIAKRYKSKHPAYIQAQERIASIKESMAGQIKAVEASLRQNAQVLKQKAELLTVLLKTALSRQQQIVQTADQEHEPKRLAGPNDETTVETAQPSTERTSILEEIRLAEQQLKMAQEKQKNALISEEEVLKIQREVAALRRELAAHDERKNVRRDLITDLAVPARDLPNAEEQAKRKALRDQVLASLFEMVKHETNSTLRLNALGSLLELQGDKTPDFLADLVLKDSDAKVRALALTGLTTHPTLLNTEKLLAIYEQLSDADLKLRFMIISRLGSARGDSPPQEKLAVAEKAIAKLQEIARGSSSSDLRQAAIRQLGAIGQDLAGASHN